MSELPAQPILASTLYTQTPFQARSYRGSVHTVPNLQRQRGRSQDIPQIHEKLRLGTGCEAIDEGALRGGLMYGEGGVITVAAGGEGGGEFTLNVLATHLLINPNPDSHAFYIDTSGTFSPAPLYRLLCARLRAPQFTHNGGYVYFKDSDPKSDHGDGNEQKASEGYGEMEALQGEADVRRKAMQMLERVRIMKVLDWTGLVEAVAECRELLERGTMAKVRKSVSRVVAVEERLDGKGNRGDTIKEVAEPQEPGTRKTKIVDSEDEDNEMLDSIGVDDTPTIATTTDDRNTLSPTLPSPPRPQPATIPPHPPHLNPSPPSNQTNAPPPPQDTDPQPNPTLLILSHLPRLLNPLMHSNHILSHALLVNLLRSLRHLTSSHQLCVVIGNGVVGANAHPNPKDYPHSRTRSVDSNPHVPHSRSFDPDTDGRGGETTERRRREGQGQGAGSGRENGRGINMPQDTPSIFADVSARPALGRTWPFLVDVSLLISRVRSGRWEKGREGGGGATRTRTREAIGEKEEDGMVDVVEVLADRCGGRVGRWAAFECGDGDGGGGGLRGVEL